MITDMKKVFRNEKGMALIWTMVTLLVLMITAGSMADIMVKESRISSSIDGSIRAFAAADSGLERATWLTKQTTTIYPYNSPALGEPVDPTDPTSPKFNISITRTGADPTYVYDIESTGKTGNISRKVVKKIDQGTTAQPAVGVYTSPVTLNSMYFSPPPYIYNHDISLMKFSNGTSASSINTATDSFNQEFVFVTKSSLSFGLTQFGLVNKADTSRTGIMVAEISPTTVGLKMGNAFPINTSFSFLPDKKYKLKLEYKKNLAVKLSLYELAVNAGGVEEEQCRTVATGTPSAAISGTYDALLFLNTPNSISPVLDFSGFAELKSVSLKKF